MLAILQFFGGSLLVLLALVCLGVAPFSDSKDIGDLVLAGVLMGAIGTLELVCGVGLWRLKGYGRTIQLVFSWIGLLGFPLGTLISALIIRYLGKPGIKTLFAGKPASQFTAEETAQVAALSQSSVGTVLTVVSVVIVGVAVIGIAAAIAVPGLLRARMADNEASAIGSLRAINLAQERYSMKCNGYAPNLPELKRAGSFLSADLTVAPMVAKSGYSIGLQPSATAALITDLPVGCVGSITDYFARADPVSAGGTGTRYFATDASGTIFQDAKGPIGNPIATTVDPVR